MSPERREFRRLLTHGLGRPLRLIRAAPEDAMQREELMRACRIDLRHDSQCEDSRAPYLYRLLRATADPKGFLGALSALIENVNDQSQDFAPVQVFEILCHAAGDANTNDRACLRRVAAEADFDAWGFGALLALIDLEGADALIFAAMRQHETIAKNIRDGDAWVLGSFLHRLEERDGAEAAAANVAAARAKSPELDALLKLKENTQPFLWDSKPPVLRYEALKASLAKGGHIPTRWSDGASDADLLRAAEDLVQETDEKRILPLLRVFWRRPFPLPPGALFTLMRHSNQRIPWTAARVLGRLRAPEVRALALALLTERENRAVALKLLYDNYEPGDIQRLETALEDEPPDAEDWEDMGGPVFALFEKNALSAPDIQPLLLRFYENLPCSICRHTAVTKLMETGGVPDWLAEEARFDASSETEALFSPPQTA